MTAVNELLILTEDEIDYARLDIDLLAELARQPIEPFIATSALASLSSRDPSRAVDACEAILQRPDADQHLRAFAMTVLYSLAPEVAVAHMRRMIESSTDVKLLEAMVENVMSAPERFASSDEDLVAKLVASIRPLPLDRFSDPDEVRAFLVMHRSG